MKHVGTSRPIQCVFFSLATVCIALADARAADPPAAGRAASEQIDRTAPLPGLVGNPQSIAGGRRWQMVSKSVQGWVKDVAWSPDGKLIAVTDLMNIRICGDDKSEPLRFFVGHTGQVTSLAWSPDGKHLVSGSYDKTARIWTREGAPAAVLQGHKARVHAVAWSRDGKWIATGSTDGTARLWDSSGKPGPVLSCPDATVLSVAFKPDNTQLATGDSQRVVRFWNIDGSAGPVCEGHAGGVYRLAWNPDGKSIASTGPGFRSEEEKELTQKIEADIRIWNADGSEQAVIDRLPTAFYGLAWTPDGSELIALDERGVLMHFGRDGSRNGSQSLRSVYPRSMSLSPDGSRIVVGARSAILVMSQTGTTEWTSTTSGRPLLFYPMASWSADGSRFAMTARNELLHIWKAEGTHEANTPLGIPFASGLAWHPDGKLLAAGQSSTLEFWNVDGTKQASPSENSVDGRIWGMAWSPDGSILCAAAGSKVYLWNRDGTRGPVLAAHTETVEEISWTSDSKRIATTSRDGTLRIWNRDGTPGPVVEPGLGDADSLTWTRDDQKLICGYNTGVIAIYNDRGERETEWHAHEDSIMSLAASPDGKRFASAGWDEIIRIWNLDGTEVREICGPFGPLYTVSWSPDGKRLLTVGRDSTLRTWNADTGAADHLIEFPGPQNPPLTLLQGGRLNLKESGALEQGFLFLVEADDGSTEIKTFENFQKLAGVR